jgi:cutinase
MTARDAARLTCAGGVTGFALLIAPAGGPTASAAPCPDVEVVFARGTFAPPGVGGIGQDFVNALLSAGHDRSALCEQGDRAVRAG